jgi:hypothetical protein
MMLGQLLSLVTLPLSAEPDEVVYEVGNPPEPPVAWTIFIMNVPKNAKDSQKVSILG